MTVEEYMNGAETPEQKEWMDYLTSDEYCDEIVALMEMDEFLGTTGES